VIEYLLDTNTCIRILNGSSLRVAQRLRAVAPETVALSAIVKAELVYGARHSGRAALNLALLQRFFEPFASLALDDRCAEEYGRIRHELEDTGRPIGPNDLLIAATARTHGLVLVSHDTREFRRVEGLRTEDWEA
jgi:tRNA(fMet)-specific endonuclease VapC